MKTILAAVLAGLICAACAQGDTTASGPGSSGIEMYGTIDQGITIRN